VQTRIILFQNNEYSLDIMNELDTKYSIIPLDRCDEHGDRQNEFIGYNMCAAAG